MSAGPNGAHGCEDLLISPAISSSCYLLSICFILLSCVKWYSSSIAKVLKGFFWFLCNCLLFTKSHGHVKIAVQKYVPLNPPDTETTYLATPNIPRGHLARVWCNKTRHLKKIFEATTGPIFSTHANYYRMYTKRHRSTDRPK